MRHTTLRKLVTGACALGFLFSGACSKFTYEAPASDITSKPQLPAFDGLLQLDTASDHKLVAHWIPGASATTYNFYHDYDVVGPNKKTASPFANSTAKQFLITGLDADRTYGYVLRAQNAVGEEKNVVVKSASTMKRHVPDFDGIADVKQIPGLPGTTAVTVLFRAANGSVGGYEIFKGTESLKIDYSAPVAQVAVQGDLVNYAVTVNGLTPATHYYFAVRSYLTDASVDEDTNTMEADTTTLGFVAPTFAGVQSASPFGGTSGFSKATVGWNVPKLDGVWNEDVIEYELGKCADGFSSNPSSSIIDDTNGTNTSAVIEGLTGNQNYRVRVRVRYVDPNGTRASYTDTNSACKDVYMQPSPAPFKGIATFTLYGPTANVANLSTAALASAFNNLVVTWVPLTIGADVSFSYYQIDYSTSPAFTTFSSIQETNINVGQRTLTGLQPNTLYFARVGVYFSSGPFSIPPVGVDVGPLRAITTPVIPTGEGILPVTNDTTTGITVVNPTTLQVKFKGPTNTGAVYSGFKFYGFCAPTGNASLAPPVEIGKLLANPNGYLASFTAANPVPNGQAIVIADPDYNYGGTAITNLYGVNGQLPNVGLSPDVLPVTVPSLPAGSQCCFQLRAYYKDGANNRLASTSSSLPYCKTPQVEAPAFTGDMTVEVPIAPQGFRAANVYVPNIDPAQAGNLGEFEIAAFPTNTIPTGDWRNASTDLPIVPGSVVIHSSAYQAPFLLDGLNYNQQYWFAARVVNNLFTPTIVRSPALTSIIAAGNHTVHPAYANGDNIPVTNAAVTPTTITVGYVGPPAKGTPSAPGGGLYNGVMFYVGTTTTVTSNDHADVTNATTGDVYKASPARILKLSGPDGSGNVSYTMPTAATQSAVLFVPFSNGNQAVNLTLRNLNPVNLYVDAYAVYWDNTSNPILFQESQSHRSSSGKPSYNSVAFSGLRKDADVDATTYPDGTAKINLTFATSGATGSYAQYKIYYSPVCPGGSALAPNCNTTTLIPDYTTALPWTTLPPSAANATQLVLPNLGTLVAGDAYFFAIAVNDNGTTNYDFSSQTWAHVFVPASKSNFVRIPKEASGMGYDYYMGTYEASLAGGSWAGNAPVVTADPQNIVRCNAAYSSAWANGSFNSSNIFQQGYCLSGGTMDASSFPRAVSAPKYNGAGVAPQTGTFGQAWSACRLASTSRMAQRLPTEEEWRRAAKFAADNYSGLWSSYTTSCNVNSGSVRNVGSAGCTTVYGAYDMAGNVREWTDRRISRDSVTRFGTSPTVGRYMVNGVDISRLDSVGLPLLRMISPPASSGLALLMGTDFRTQDTSNFRFPSVALNGKISAADAALQTWEPPATTDASIGFRCVGLLPTPTIPGVAQTTLATQPVWAAGDTIPENLAAGDARPETVSIDTAGKTVTISWPSWTRKYCTDASTCSTDSNFTYYVYRFPEPSFSDIRTETTWGLKDPSMATAPYSDATPLDPFALNSDLTRAWPTPSGGLVVTSAACSGGICSFTDSVGSNLYNYTNYGYPGVKTFRSDVSYIYYIVAKDGAGNNVGARVQRYRSPFFTGDVSKNYASSTFRSEPRMRRAGVYLVDETYQVAHSKQTMAYVSMDKSGDDHDFYIYKYEGYAFNGSPDAGAGDNLPLPQSGTNYSAAACHESYLRTHNPSAACGVAGNGAFSASTIEVRSDAGDTRSLLNYGDAYTACRYSRIKDGENVGFAMYLTTNVEWTKAAQWGDTALDGNINDNPYLSASYPTVAAIEAHCNATGVTAANGARPECVSRHGVVSMVGNEYELTADRIKASVWQENGIDGLLAGLTSASNGAGSFDILRGFFPTSGGIALPTNNGNIFFASPVDSSTYTVPRGGGGRGTVNQPGRYTFGWDYTSSGDGFRCSF